MFTIYSIAGNIFDDKLLQQKFKKSNALAICERLRISRLESKRVRLRKKTDKGTDIGLILEPGRTLRHGDILLSTSSKSRSKNKKIIIVEQLPEKVISIKIRPNDIKPSSDNTSPIHNKSEKDLMEILVSIGHIIGNKHRPIAIASKERKISFPANDDCEIDVFRRLLSSMGHHIELRLEQQIFQPQYHGMEMHSINDYN